jgi:hypothetical protein
MIINSIFLALFYKSLGLRLTMAVVVLLSLGAIYFGRGFATKYVSSTLNAAVKTILVLVQLGFSMIFGAMVPNNYLSETEFFYSLYEKSGIWIPITMVLAFILIFMITGIFLSLTLGIFYPQMKKEDL